ncbi:MAG: chromate transporter [Spirochaetales bacterium]|nr:chromate transporter [Spirochaetales bacterium]
MIYLELFWVFCRIGVVSFGGGYAMISLIRLEVLSRGWCLPHEFVDMVALSQMTPGPVALNTATYVGKVTAGIPGSLAATLGLIFPALCLTTLVIRFLTSVKQNRSAEPWIRGIRAAAVGLIGTAVIFFMENSLVEGELTIEWGRLIHPGSWKAPVFYWQGIVIFIIVLILKKKFNLKPFWLILLSLGLGAGLFSL